MISVTPCGLYLRISEDGSGQGLGVDRQRTDTLALAEQRGWQVLDQYVDNDVSATKTKRRPEYQRMLADVESGRIRAIVVWDIDRLTRRPAELEHIIDLADRLNVSLASVGGEVDLATPQGRLTARIKGAVAKHEVEQSSRRIKAKMLQLAESGGSPHGRRTYGWRRLPVTDGAGRRTGSRDVVDAGEAAVVQEMAARVLNRETLTAIARDLSARGILAPSGGKWNVTTVRQVLLRERNTGQRVFLGIPRRTGDWEAILDQETYDRVRALLTDPRRSPIRATARTYSLLSGIAVCGVCEATMIAGSGRPTKAGVGERIYKCATCMRITRRAQPVEDLVIAVVTGRLAKPDASQLLSPQAADSSTFIARADAIRAKLNSAAEAFVNDELDAEQLGRITASLRPQLAEAKRAADACLGSSSLLPFARPDISDVWKTLTAGTQRELIRTLVTIYIRPVGKSGVRQFDPRGVAMFWNAGPDAGQRVDVAA
jgi:site-specific DNA recombinase